MRKNDSSIDKNSGLKLPPAGSLKPVQARPAPAAAPANDRDMLLNAIRGGAALKHVVSCSSATNFRQYFDEISWKIHIVSK